MINASFLQKGEILIDKDEWYIGLTFYRIFILICFFGGPCSNSFIHVPFLLCDANQYKTCSASTTPMFLLYVWKRLILSRFLVHPFQLGKAVRLGVLNPNSVIFALIPTFSFLMSYKAVFFCTNRDVVFVPVNCSSRLFIFRFYDGIRRTPHFFNILCMLLVTVFCNHAGGVVLTYYISNSAHVLSQQILRQLMNGQSGFSLHISCKIFLYQDGVMNSVSLRCADTIPMHVEDFK